MGRSDKSKRHRSNQSLTSLAIENGTNQYLNDNNHHIDLPLSSPIQCSAYFISRLNLKDYTTHTLKQTVDSVVSGPESKGQYKDRKDNYRFVY
jgi:hypothetical protein